MAVLVFFTAEGSFVMIPDIQHVCFDKDGTLIDVHLSWVPITERRTQKIREFYNLGRDIHHALALAMGVDLKTQRIVKGGPVGYKSRPIIIGTVVRWLNNRKIQATKEELAKIFADVDYEVQAAQDFHAVALPGVIEGITRLKQRGFKISVYTSDRQKNAQVVMKLIGLEGLVDAVVGGDNVQKSKPDPEGFIKACVAVDVVADHSVYVGDSVDDMKVMKGHTLGVAQGTATFEELSGSAAKVFKTFRELTDYLLAS